MTQSRNHTRRSASASTAPGVPNADSETAISPHAPVDPMAEFTRVAAIHGGLLDGEGNPTADGKAASREAKRRIKKRKPAVILSRAEDGGILNPVGSAHERILETFGSNSSFFMVRQLFELENMTARRGEERERSATALNSALAMVAAVAPTDEIEAALAVQMAGNHALSCEMAARIMRNDDINQMNTYLNAATKLQRTFVAQIEALARLRGKGQQTVRVEHVTVEAGAQAIVGDVHHHQPHRKPKDPARVTTARPRRGKALPRPHPIDPAVSGPGDEERPMQDARRSKHGGADR